MTSAYTGTLGLFARNRPQTRVYDSAGLAGFLRRQAPINTCAHVAARAGVPVRTVERWLTTDARPSVSHFLALVEAFGPSLIRAAFTSAPAWLDDAVRAEQQCRLEAEIGRLQRELENSKRCGTPDAQDTHGRAGHAVTVARE